MGIVVVFFIWYFVIGRNRPDIYNKLTGKLPLLIIVMIALGAFSFMLPLAGILFSLLSPILVFAVPFIFIIGAIKKSKKEDVDVNDRKRNDFLTKAVPKRTKIITKFNRKYGLLLTKEQIQMIVNASYISYEWENEIIAMDADYNTIYEWFGANPWLRAYLYAFNVQELSADFIDQRAIVLKAFKQIFSEMDFLKYATRKDMLWDLNNKYMTRFDDVTFMIAYRFLADSGYSYDIGGGRVVRNQDEADILKQKYEI